MTPQPPAWAAYAAVRPLLFSLDAERAHHLTLFGMGLGHRLLRGLLPPSQPLPGIAHTVAGLVFPNRVGLGAGLDKNADHLDALGRLGFGFLEVGTVTPRPQPGNPQPRMFRLPQAQALINRLGFNNLGLEVFLENVKRSTWVRERRGILGLNIGKNADTPIDRAVDDYQMGLEAVYPWADYVTVNISSPNTTLDRQAVEGLRHAQEAGGLSGGPLSEKSTLVLRQMRSLLGAEVAIIGVGGILSAQDGLEKAAAGADLVQVYTGLIYRGPTLVSDLTNAFLACQTA